MGRAADFIHLWSPRELGREVTIESADDVERVKNWLVEDVDSQPLRELGDYFWHATVRIREIRSN